ncbi:MAG: bifunctional serine/threonine-protein kinase/formylglycine-generating enzyme family protein [Pseudomonadales bacterium]|jgi:formylglycine-generating enzyme required for sulfatase activity/tRNA A-37 threonylcarbamoyl transferase component Bud32|nr:bifunctional serine/threonine-protein kinase/formylglycine-generating enzyme family protein [Pseudomonadales bacterium]
MFNLRLSLIEHALGNTTLDALKAEIEQAITSATVEARQLVEQLESSPEGLQLTPEARSELVDHVLASAATRLRAQQDTQAGAEASTPSTHASTTIRATPTEGDATSLRSRTAVRGEGYASPLDVDVGSVLNDRFELVEAIGRGGFSAVFKAVDRRRVQARSRYPHVALKVMTVEGAAARKARDAMQREAERSQMLNHPFIVRVHDFDHDGAVVYMTMEFMSGRPLDDVIREEGPEGLPDERAARYASRIAEALSYAHQKGIVHADLKPSNVFITDEDEVKVIDFGIARALPRRGPEGTTYTVFDAREELGAHTPAYASPEMLENEPADPRDDLYSLGCIVHELYTGRHPFAGMTSVAAKATEVRLRRPPQMSKGRWRSVEHLLAFEREARTPDAETFLRELAKGEPSRTPLAVVAAAAVTIVAIGAGLGLYLLRDWEPADAPRAAGPLQDCPECPVIAPIPAARFAIGLADSQRGNYAERGFFESPVVDVSLAAPFYIGMHEVTVGEYRAFAESVPADRSGCRTIENDWSPDPARSWADPGFAQTDSHPVTCVSWSDAQRYVAWLSRRTGEAYRLPSEAEWEFVAREYAPAPARGDPGYCAAVNGADQATLGLYHGLSVAACSDGHAHTAPIGRSGAQAPSDLIGNVFEWTQDCWSDSHEGIPRDGRPRVAADCREQVLRGGSWLTAPSELRPTFRNRFPRDYRSNTFGFRVARARGETG